MIATTRPRPRAERFRCAARWLWPAALLALMPKCLLCVAAYIGLGAALGLSGPELCGAPASSLGTWVAPLAWLGIAIGIVGSLMILRRRRNLG